MHFGQYFFGKTTVFGPWMKRGADNAMFTYEEIDATGGGAITVKIYHKNADEAGPGEEITSSFSTIAAGIKEAKVSGLRELVRFQFSSESVASNTWMLYRTLPTVWFNTPNA